MEQRDHELNDVISMSGFHVTVKNSVQTALQQQISQLTTTRPPDDYLTGPDLLHFEALLELQVVRSYTP